MQPTLWRVRASWFFQMDEMMGNMMIHSLRVGAKQVALLESAIDHLDKLQLIDRKRIGIIGFKCLPVLDVAYAPHHIGVLLAAARHLTDGQDGGYFGYISTPSLWPCS